MVELEVRSRSLYVRLWRFEVYLARGLSCANW